MAVNKQAKKAFEEGYSFQGAWLSDYSTEEEKQRFKERRTELKNEGNKIKTLRLDEGKGLFIKRGGN